MSLSDAMSSRGNVFLLERFLFEYSESNLMYFLNHAEKVNENCTQQWNIFHFLTKRFKTQSTSVINTDISSYDIV